MAIQENKNKTNTSQCFYVIFFCSIQILLYCLRYSNNLNAITTISAM